MTSKLCKRIQQEFDYVHFTPDTVLETIKFFGMDFVAITNGSMIEYKGIKIKLDPNDEIQLQPDLKTGVVVFEWFGKVQVAPVNVYIIRDPLYGYQLIQEDQFKMFYDADEPDVKVANTELVYEDPAEENSEGSMTLTFEDPNTTVEEVGINE